MSSLIFRIIYADPGNSYISIVGNIPELGAWDPKKSIQLSNVEGAIRTEEIKF